MAGLVFDPKNFKKNKWNDPFSPYLKPVMEFARDTVKDTAVSSGQIANEMANQGQLFGPVLGPASGLLLKRLLGKDYLSKAAGRINPRIGESMRGEVTPMDVVNLASVLPIPAGAGVRAGLVAFKLGSKALPRALKGGKYVAASNIPVKPSIVARVAERTMASPFTEAIGEGALNVPAVPSIWDNDSLDLKTKVGLTAAIMSGVFAPSAMRGLAKSRGINKRVAAAEQNIVRGQGTGVDYAVANTSRVKSSQSDLTLSMDTEMPEAAAAALTIGQSGDSFKQSVRLYETDAEFRRIIDDVSSGRITASKAIDDYNLWKSGIKPGFKPKFIPQSSFPQIEYAVKTGELSNKRTMPLNREGEVDFQKTDRLRESLLLNPVKGGVGDTRELQLYDALVDAGEIPGVQIGKTKLFRDHVNDVRARNPNAKDKYKLADAINSRKARIAMRQVDDWIRETYGITSQARMAAIRERLYQGIGHSGTGLTGYIF